MLAGGLLALAGAVGVGGPALADPPPDLGSGYLRDDAGVIGDRPSVEAAIDDAYARTGVSLFVVLVPSFDDPDDAYGWADATARRNDLGVNDVLLAIATDDRSYAWSADLGTLSDAQLDAMSQAVESHLRAGAEDWDAAVIAGADTMADQLAPPFPAVPVAIGAGVVVLVGLGIGAAALVRRGRSRRAAAESAKDLDTRAGSLLVKVDDAVTTSEQELGFAVAQFGEQETAAFRAALDQAKAQVKEAFGIRHRLDDAEPETAGERRTLTQRIIELCEAADAALDAQEKAFDELRALEKNAPQLVESLAVEQQELGARIDAADATVKRLVTTFGASAADAVDENPGQARRLSAFAASSLGKARTALEARKTTEAAADVRAAQQAIGQVGQLVAAVDKAATELAERQQRAAEASASLSGATADARAAIDAAKGYIETRRGAVGASARARLAEAETRLGESASRGSADPVAALTAAQDAERLASTALSLARSDVTSFTPPAYAHDRDAWDDDPSSADDSGGAVLGGILDALFSGDGRGSSWRGSGSGWSWGGGSSSRRSSWSRPSGFGGSGSSSSRRSFSSSRSSGRRSRGGRF